jgi:hypothetical protein
MAMSIYQMSSTGSLSGEGRHLFSTMMLAKRQSVLERDSEVTSILVSPRLYYRICFTIPYLS